MVMQVTTVSAIKILIHFFSGLIIMCVNDIYLKRQVSGELGEYYAIAVSMPRWASVTNILDYPRLGMDKLNIYYFTYNIIVFDLPSSL